MTNAKWKKNCNFAPNLIFYIYMNRVVKIKKGLDIQLQGVPEARISTAPVGELYAIVPDDFVGLTPKVVVKPGEQVLAGSPLFHDKNHPEVLVTSPVSGEVVAVERGERRKVLRITIKPEASQQALDLGKCNPDQATAEELKSLLLRSGIFALIKQRPYDIVANPEVAPRDIFVTAFDSAPLAPDYALLLKEEMGHLEVGLKALGKLTAGKVYVGTSATQPLAIKNAEVIAFDGPHPAGNVGVQINHIAPINKGEIVWTMNALDVVLIGRLLDKGAVDFSRTVAVTGSEVEKPHYVRTCVGAPLSSILHGLMASADYERRYISGNVLTGVNVGADGFLGAIHNQITVIPEGNTHDEFLGWATLSPCKYSTSHSYFSWLFGSKKRFALDARLKGGERAIIMSDEYDRVFPMDIYPEYLIKAILAFDIDKMENLGVYEIAPEDFALCEFVDTSKLELQKIVREGLNRLMKEMN